MGTDVLTFSIEFFVGTFTTPFSVEIFVSTFTTPFSIEIFVGAIRHREGRSMMMELSLVFIGILIGAILMGVIVVLMLDRR